MSKTEEKVESIGVLDDNVMSGRTSWIAKIKDLFWGQSDKEENYPQDRRKSPRFQISVPVFYQIEDKHNKWQLTKSLDVSETGIRISVTKKLHPGTHISLDIKLPNMDDFMKIRGVVVWAKPSTDVTGLWDCGVAFENLRQVSCKEKIISLIADQHCRFAMAYTKEFKVGPVQTFTEMVAAYQILYLEYLSRAYCEINPWKLHYNVYSLLPTTTTINLNKKDRLLGTISLIGDSPCGLPMETIFPEEIQKLRAEGRALAEVGFLALDSREFKQGFFSLTNFKKQACLFRLYKTLFDYARFVHGATDLIIGVHPKHETLYKYLQFEPFGPVRSYPGAKGNPALPFRMDIAKVIQKVSHHKHGPASYFLKDPTPLDTLNQKMQWAGEHLAEMLEKKMLWDSLTPKQQEAIEKVYPGIRQVVRQYKNKLAALDKKHDAVPGIQVFFENILSRFKSFTKKLK